MSTAEARTRTRLDPPSDTEEHMVKQSTPVKPILPSTSTPEESDDVGVHRLT